MKFGNSEKDVHVKSYTREGDTVKEHWRSRPGTGGFVEQRPEPELGKGGPIFVPLPDEDGIKKYMDGGVILEGGIEVTKFTLKALLDTLAQIAKEGGEVLSQLTPEALRVLKFALDNKLLHNPSSAAEAATLNGRTEMMPNNYNHRDISKMQLERRAKPDIRQTNVGKENIDKILSELLSMQKTAKDVYDSANEKMQYVNNIPKYMQIGNAVRDDFVRQPAKYIKPYFNDGVSKVFKYLNSEETYNKYAPLFKEHPKASLPFLYLMAYGTEITNAMDSRHSAQLLKAALDFDKNAPKIENTFIARSYKQLEPLSEFIKEKLISQNMDPDKTPGIVYMFDSGISQDIAQSQEIKDFAKKYAVALNNKQPITTSLRIDSTTNLYTSVNLVDVELAYYDHNGNLIMVLLDTSDYNKGEKKLPVYWGNLAQEKNLIDGFFNLFLVKVPYGTF